LSEFHILQASKTADYRKQENCFTPENRKRLLFKGKTPARVEVLGTTKKPNTEG
jgi:hypothetical protein